MWCFGTEGGSRVVKVTNARAYPVVITYNGSAFTFDTDLDVELEFDLDPPLVVSQTSSSDVTVLVDLATWFRVESGLLIHPESANTGGDNESVVEENIKNSLEAFEDEDRDGSAD